MKCYPEVLEVIKAAENRFSDVLAKNEEAVSAFRDTCQLMDGVAEGFGAGFIDIEIDDQTGVLSLAIEVPDLILRDNANGFYDLVERAAWFEFRKLKGDNVRFRVYFDSLWEEVK